MNKTYIPVAPDKPVALNEQRVLTYLPKLAYSNPGIMKFTAEHFVVTNGEVIFNQQFMLRPRIMVSLDEPVLDSVQTWYKWLYNYIHLGGNITDSLNIDDDLDGFGNAQAASSASIIINVTDSVTGKSATIFLNAAVIDTLKIIDSQPSGITQYILNSNLIESLQIITGTPTGVKQLNYLSNLLDTVSTSAVCFGVKQLNYQTTIVDELIIIDDTYGVKQLNLLSLITDELLIIDNTYGVEVKDGKFTIADSIVIVDQLPTGLRELFDMAVIDDQVIIENSVSVIAQLNLDDTLSDTLKIIIDSTGVMQEFHVAPHLTDSFTIIDNITGISQHSMNSDSVDNLVISVAVAGISQHQQSSSVVDSIHLSISADGLFQINRSSNIEDSFGLNYTDPVGVAEEALYEVRFYGKDSAPPDTPLKTQFVLENKHATPPTPPIIPGFEFDSWDGIYTNVKADVNIYAIYNILYYSVTFKLDGTTVYIAENLTYGQSAVPPTVTKEGHTFSHWTKSYQNITGNVITEAVFTINTYTITWKSYGTNGTNGVVLKTDTNTPYNTVVSPPTGTTDTVYYDYAWPVASYTVKETKTFTETRTQKSYLVRWYYFGGNAQFPETYIDNWVLAGSTVEAPLTNTEWTGYYSYNWPVTSISDITEHRTYQEVRATRYYTITWKSYGTNGTDGVVLKTDTNKTYQSTSTAPTTGTDDTEYYIYYWANQTYIVTESTTLVEVRANRIYTIQWRKYDTSAILKTEYLQYADISYPPNNTPSTNEWAYGWPMSSYTVKASVIITETAHIKYPVTWKYSNGTVAKTEYLIGGSVSNAPLNTTWTNYVMYYWPSQSYTITQALVITEQFADRYYTITWQRYGTNGTNGTVTTNSVTYGTNVDAPATTTWTAQYAYEWQEYRATGGIDETIYEIRYLRYYTVTFEYNYDTPQTTQSVAYGGKATGFTPTRVGYTFGGWYTNSSLTTLYNFTTSVTTDKTLYAKWTSNVTVGWVAGGTAPTRYQTCADIDDVNNVRCDVTCSWEYYEGPFLSMTNDSTNPQCSGGATRTVCTKSGGKFWQCYVEEGKITYTNCETCEVL